MSFAYPITFASDFFRVAYQGIDAVAQNKPVLTLNERIAQVMRNQIALLDAFFTIGEYTGTLEHFSEWLAPYRIAAIVQGLYLLETDPNADKQSIKHDIIHHLMNITRIAMTSFGKSATTPAYQTFFNGAALALAIGDTAFRMYSIFNHGTALVEGTKEIYHQISPEQLYLWAKRAVIEGGDYILRAALTSAIIWGVNSRLASLYTDTPLKSIYEIAGWVVLTSGFGLMVHNAVHHIFSEMGFQESRLRRLAEILFSLISSATLMAVVAVGLGRIASISNIFKPLCSALLTTALVFSLGCLFKTSISTFLNALSVQESELRSIGEWSFTIICSVSLAAFALVGFGLNKTISNAVDRIIQASLTPLLTAISISLSIGLPAAAMIFGPPSWEELGYLIKFV